MRRKLSPDAQAGSRPRRSVKRVLHPTVSAGFAYVWEYHVVPEHSARFEAAYGPEGAWAKLFRRQEGYLRTDLLLDQQRSGRYLTVDYWRSQADRDDFQRQFAAEFDSLDASCAEWTVSERHLGDFTLR